MAAADAASDNLRVPSDALETMAREALASAGADDFSARETAAGLVHGSLRGVDSHGIRLLPHYVTVLESGRVNHRPSYAFEQSAPATGTLEADHAFGLAAGVNAMEHAIAMAQSAGVGVVSIRNTSHCGILAHFTLPAAERGLLGFSCANTTPRMATPGATRAYFGTNPLCAVAPMRDEAPLCFDAALTIYTGNKIRLYETLGQPLPEGIARDEAGYPTADPAAARFLEAIGGYKGWGLAYFVDLLTGLLAGLPNADEVSHMYGNDLASPRRLGNLVAVIDIARFQSLDDFCARVQATADRIRATPALDEQEPVAVPGDPEKWAERDRRRQGIPIQPAVADRLREAVKSVGVNLPF